jgi:hypothetical protein
VADAPASDLRPCGAVATGGNSCCAAAGAAAMAASSTLRGVEACEEPKSESSVAESDSASGLSALKGSAPARMETSGPSRHPRLR